MKGGLCYLSIYSMPRTPRLCVEEGSSLAVRLSLSLFDPEARSPFSLEIHPRQRHPPSGHLSGKPGVGNLVPFIFGILADCFNMG